jgi:hypothetical protein
MVMQELFRALNKKVLGSVVNIPTTESVARKYGATKKRKADKGLTGNVKLRDLVQAFQTTLNSIKINSITLEMREGRPMWVKRRRAGSKVIAGAANLFLHLARALIRVWVDPKKWQRWEVDCYHLLYDHDFCAYAEGSRTVCVDTVPGESLLKHVTRGTLTPRILRAAAREFRRAHQLWSEELDGPWSHGDPHLGNVIYDQSTDRARLIDFEVIHHKSLPAVVRQADDLLVFLQDLVGLVSAEQWLSFALCFINAYGQPEITAELRKRLVVPSGVPGLWWKLRTEYLERRELIRRIDALRHALDEKPNDSTIWQRFDLATTVV